MMAADQTDRSPADGDRVDLRGWVLVAAVVVTLGVVPGVLILAPPTWLTYRTAFLALPVLPAALLGLVAVWAGLSSSAR